MIREQLVLLLALRVKNAGAGGVQLQLPNEKRRSRPSDIGMDPADDNLLAVAEKP
jgi:hypothetical protein